MEKKEEKKEENEDLEKFLRNLKEVKFVKELPDKPEPNVCTYYVDGIWTYDVYTREYGYFMSKFVVATSQGNRLLLSIIQTLIRIIDAMLIVGSLKKQSKGFYNFDYYMCLTALQCRLKDKFYYIMENEDRSCNNSILKSVKIVL